MWDPEVEVVDVGARRAPAGGLCMRYGSQMCGTAAAHGSFMRSEALEPEQVGRAALPLGVLRMQAAREARGSATRSPWRVTSTGAALAGVGYYSVSTSSSNGEWYSSSPDLAPPKHDDAVGIEAHGPLALASWNTNDFLVGNRLGGPSMAS